MKTTIARALTAALALSIFSTTIAFAAPQYPPVIQQPVKNEPIIAPTVTLSANAKVALPIAQATSVPILTPSTTRPSSDLSASRRIPATIATPIAITRNVLLGGVSTKDRARTPIATFNCAGNVEVQLVEDVPTTLVIANLPRRTAGNSVLLARYTTTGSRVSLGTLAVDPTRRISLPPITIAKKNTSMDFEVRYQNEAICSFTIRAVA